MVTPSEELREQEAKKRRERAEAGVTDSSAVEKAFYKEEEKRKQERRERAEKPPEPTPEQVAIPKAYEQRESEYKPSSTMYKMGFRTKQEYSEAQRAGVAYGKHEGELVPKESVLVTTSSVYEGDRPITVRYSGETAKKHPDISRAIFGAIRKGEYTVPVTDLSGRTRYLPPKEAEEAFKKIQAQWAVKTKVVDASDIDIANTQVGTNAWIDNAQLAEMKKKDPTGYTILTEKGIDAYNKLYEQRQAEIARFEKLNVELPDGSWINKTDLINIKSDDQKGYAALITQGYSAYDKLVDVRRNIQDRKAIELAPYTTSDGTDVAKFIRDKPGSENALKDYGFTDKNIKEANDQNKKYYGIGAPDYIDTDTFMRQYFKNKGWDWSAERKKTTLAGVTLSQLDSYSNKMRSARDAHDMQFKAPLAPAQFQELYFKDKGWKYDINRADVTESEATKHSLRVIEANKLYTSKYGNKAIFESGMGKIADFVPFVELRHWEEMSSVERGVNLGIDIAFTALIFGRPIGSAVSGILKRAFGNRGLKTIETTIQELATAINSGNPRQIERAAYRMSNLGQMMNATGISGGQELAVRANAIARNAKVMATLSNEVAPSQVKTMLKQMGKNLKEFAGATERGQAGFIRLDPLPAKKLTKEGVKTAVAPITRAEAKGLGLTTTAEEAKAAGQSRPDVDVIFDLVGENRGRFLAEAQRIVRLRNEALFDQINAFISKTGGLKSNPMTYKAPVKKLPPTIQEVKPVEKHIAEDVWKSFDKQRAAIRKAYKQKMPDAQREEYLRQLAAITEKAEASIKKTLSGLAKKRKATTTEAFAIGIPGRLTFAKMQELLNDWAKMKPAYTADQLAEYNLTSLAIATNAKQMAKVLANVSAQTRAKILANVDTQIKHALGLGNLAQAQILAKALTMAQSKTNALAMAKSMTDALTSTRTLGLVETKAEPKPAPKLAPAPVPVPVPIPIPIPKPTPKPARKMAVKPPPAVRLIKTPPPRIITPRPIKPIKPAPTKPVKPKPVKPVKPIKPIKPIKPFIPFPKIKYTKEGRRIVPKGTITWRQGKFWYAIKPPYNSKADVLLLKKPPAGAEVKTGIKSAYRTIQALGGDVSIVLNLDLGAQDIIIRHPARKAGRKGAIKYRKDPRQKTKGDITLKGIRSM